MALEGSHVISGVQILRWNRDVNEKLQPSAKQKDVETFCCVKKQMNDKLGKDPSYSLKLNWMCDEICMTIDVKLNIFEHVVPHIGQRTHIGWGIAQLRSE